MDERNKDLPLIVSEILIEMHEMKEALNRVASVVVKQQEHTNNMFNTLLDENRKNMEFMTYSINKALGQQQQVNAAFEQRLTELEAKYNG
ncbi:MULTISPECIES: hypothetical protein [Hymenobacter]|uniref:Uncharacterized protein n=1 Tax=Hymenobacter metallilatus TaxID=2493666 RepID=A0A428JI96_9BACT|nr:hypothetical protein [Hymenobacter metallilatus]RSK32401.1 hypothetical protein EI290_11765 [Hymenobacter metallilatus]